ncbi:hypothetical protein SAMD00023353_1200550 [Rosellinia necatrix]|uniref:Uncharacterized protein n=1 Tax=Rosellinia necatrix TaxID=77044 RepID=A0A1W2TLQ5_ROSNE|nr:hypothetical protein SAMD00023353_1200550 [Rosellinia necatrix]
MQQHIVFRLSALLTTQLSIAGVFSAPGRNNAAGAAASLIIVDGFGGSTSLNTFHDMTTAGAVMADTNIVKRTTCLDMVAVAVTAVDTTTVNVITSGPDGLDSSGIVTVIATASESSNADIPLGLANSFRHARSTSSSPHGTSTHNSTATFAKVTSAASSLFSTSSFDEALCDDIFCNTEGNKVCIYWAGYTSYDVSRGPLPGEQPTVLGPCEPGPTSGLTMM